jgi:hypothetical protein
MSILFVPALSTLPSEPKNMKVEDLDRIGYAIDFHENLPEDHYNHFWEEQALQWGDFNEYMDAPQQVKEWAAEDYKCSF